MRTSTIPFRMRPHACRALLLIALVAVMSGCGTLRATMRSYETGWNGIAMPQQRLREALVRADFPTALGFGEEDALLRALNVGVSSYYASQFSRSAAVLDSAALLADDRITESISRGALALITNDLAMSYQPRRTERLFIPYYGMLSFARMDQWEDAAVEARRLTALLAQYADDREEAERSTHAVLHYLAGAVFERAGEKQDAQVAYRNARALVPLLTDSVGGAAAAGDGDVLVVVERGFVAHRATESINVFLGESDRDSLRGSDHDSNARAASRIAERLSRAAASSGSWNPSGRDPRRGRGRHRDRDGDDDDDGGYWLSLALPSLRRSAKAAGGDLVLLVDGTGAGATRVSSILDDAALVDEGRERTALLSRALVRAAAKYAIAKAVRDKKGEVAGTVANIGASLLERADVRSWHLLPQEIVLLRVRVPAGQHQLQVGAGADGMPVDVGPVTVRAGQVTIASVRLWKDPQKVLVAVR